METFDSVLIMFMWVGFIAVASLHFFGKTWFGIAIFLGICIAHTIFIFEEKYRTEEWLEENK